MQFLSSFTQLQMKQIFFLKSFFDSAQLSTADFFKNIFASFGMKYGIGFFKSDAIVKDNIDYFLSG
jgi:hypothetical protein